MKRTRFGITMALGLMVLQGGLAAGNNPGDTKWLMASRLYDDTKCRRVGDLLTVMIIEDSSHSSEASHKTAKKSDISGSLSFSHPTMDNTSMPWTNVALPAFSAAATRNFEGGGSLQNQEQIKSTMTVRVMEVLPNGNLLVEGKRFFSMQGEETGYVLTGTVRPYDVTRDNTVKSTQIADLNIQALNSGSVAQSTKKGLFNSVIDWINPF